MPWTHLELANHLAAAFQTFPQVKAITISGSLASGAADSGSDIDLYIYTTTPIPAEERMALIRKLGPASGTYNEPFWGADGDEWYHAESGIRADCIYFNADWMEEQISRVLDRFEASQGYSTCFWHNVRQSRALYDPQGWYARLKEKASQPYPEELRQSIVAFNHPTLRRVTTSYHQQLSKAVKRDDPVSVNHRLTEIFHNYFDILFAVNRVTHPGEKRLLSFAGKLPRLPESMEADVRAVLAGAGNPSPALIADTDRMLDRLDTFLLTEGFSLPIRYPGEIEP